MLRVEHLDVYYNAIQALNDVSIEVPEKSLVTIIGANGAGKSTLLNTIAGLVDGQQGDILIDEIELGGLPAHKRASNGVALVPEGRQIFPDFTVLENLMIGVYSKKDRKEQLKKQLPKIYSLFPRLKERSQQRGGTLSGGEQQMLAISRALISEPKLLMLDEPSMGLAPIFQKTVRDSLLVLKDQGWTILLVEQNASLAMSVADYVYLLEVGRVVAQGPVEQMKENPLVKKAYLGN